MANTYSLDLEAGSSQYASITDASQTGLDFNTDFSIECWIKLESGARQVMVSKGQPGDADANYGYDLEYQGASANDPIVLLLNGASSGVGGVTYNTNASLEDGEWHHIAVTVDLVNGANTTSTLYIDGVEKASSSITAVGNLGNAELFEIGNVTNKTNRFFDGLIDEVRVWSDIRTQAEIATNMYQDVASDEAGLVGYWQFENDYLDKTANNNDLTASGSPVFVSTANSVPFTYYLESTDNITALDLELSSSQYAYIADNASLSITGDISIEAWIKLDALTTGSEQTIVSKFNDTTQCSFRFWISGTTNKLDLIYSVDGTSGSTKITRLKANSALASTEWIHVAVTADVSEKTGVFYINGESDGSAEVFTGNATSIYDSTANFAIGCSYNSSSPEKYLDGLIDEVRVWSDIRTSGEISANYQTQLDGDESNLVGEWDFEGNYLDNTANNNDLTSSGSPAFTHESAFDTNNRRSLDLELSSSQYAYIADNASLSITGDISIEAWIKLDALTTGSEQTIVSKFNGTTQCSFRFWISGTTNKLDLIYSVDGTSGSTKITRLKANSALASTEWIHVAVTADVSEKTGVFYINGESDGSAEVFTGNATSIYDSTANFAIGCSYNSSSPEKYLDGLIDEVRVWSDIRTSGEISANYQTQLDGDESNLVGYWRLNGNYTDLTTNNNNLTPSGSPVFSRIVPFDGSTAATAAYIGSRTLLGVGI